MAEASTHDLTIEEWRQVVQDANTTMLSKREWCLQAGISEKQLYYWQRKLREIDKQEQDMGSSPEETQEDSTFVVLPLKVSSPEIASPSVVQIVAQQPAPEPSKPVEAFPKPFIAEMAIQTERFQVLIGGNVSENALRTVMRVLRHA